MKFSLGPGLTCDLQKLIDTRALVQANSGGGKSHTLRRLLEQTHGRVQQLVIDPEGEFASLREKYDYVLAARTGGDTAADPRGAKLLAERLLELGVSAILDIYELKAHERIRFVRAFLEALVDAPKTLWHPVLVVVDEAHVFCPQQGEAESAGAVIDLCTRGRKRGFSAILATQRLSKLHKDAAAELNNKLIGRTGLDVDRKRAGEELGFTTKEQLLSLRQLEPGHFYAFGPALSLEVQEVAVGPVQTTHPKAGSRIAFTPPPPTDKVKALLPQLADLPAEAEQKQRTEADLKKDLQQARATITRLERAAPVQTAATDTAAIAELRAAVRQAETNQRALQAHNDQLTKALERLMKFILEINAQDFFKAGGEAVDQAAVQKAIDAAAQQLVKLVEQDLSARRKAFERWRAQGEQLLAQMSRLVKQDVTVSVAVKHNEPYTVSRPPVMREPTSGELSGPEQRIVDGLAELEAMGAAAPPKELVAFLAGYTNLASKGFANSVSALRTTGRIAGTDGRLQLTDAGRSFARAAEAPRSTEELQQRIMALLGNAATKILTPLIAAYPGSLQRPDLMAQAGYTNAASKGFANNLSRLRTLGFIEYPDRASVIAKPVLFLEGAA